jgi:transcriptional regulator with AAA-type ATPase domain
VQFRRNQCARSFNRFEQRRSGPGRATAAELSRHCGRIQPMAPRTITRTGSRPRSRDRLQPFLFIALRSDRPMDPAVRFSVGDAQIVAIGRASSLSADRQGSELRIGLPDPEISSKHLRLQSLVGGWVADDPGSKNGTLLDGRRISREQIGDGAILELGHTFLLFRSALPTASGDLLMEARDPQPALQGLLTISPLFAGELDRVRAVALSRVPVLLLGESGTGKELLAAAIHRLSGRTGPFQPVNCGAIPDDLIESVLFGHRKGAFSGAVEEHPGLLRGADRGTLLLDEIGDLPLPAQAALLRVLQEEEVRAVGATRAVKVDLRVVSATHRDLDEMVAQRTFRADLLARLSGYACTLPPLRERREDFGLLVAALLARLGGSGVTFTAEAARALLRYSWPRNVRELEKCLATAVALCKDVAIDLEHLPASVRASPASPSTSADLRLREDLVAQLRVHHGNVTAMARAMGKARAQVQRWLRRFRLDPGSFRR